MVSKAALAATVLVLAGESSAAISLTNAEQAFYTLQGWYNPGSGIWDGDGWWNGANAFTVVAELAAAAQAQNDSSVLQSAKNIFDNTWVVGPTSNGNLPASERTLGQYDSSNSSVWGGPAYDDNGWWALGWIAAYDVTNNDTYLELAKGMFDHLVSFIPLYCYCMQCIGLTIPRLPMLGEQDAAMLECIGTRTMCTLTPLPTSCSFPLPRTWLTVCPITRHTISTGLKRSGTGSLQVA